MGCTCKSIYWCLSALLFANWFAKAITNLICQVLANVEAESLEYNHFLGCSKTWFLVDFYETMLKSAEN